MKRKLLLCLVGVLALTGCGKEEEAKDVISKEAFETGLNNFIKSEVNEDTYKAKLEDEKMIVTYWDNDYTLTYNFKENPSITYEVEVKKGTSYEDYTTKSEGFALPMLGYFAIADTYSVAAADSYAYFTETYLDGVFNSIDEDKESYIITDDADGYNEDDKIILTSEFDEKVIDYIEYTYNKDLKIEDEKYDTFSYELTTKCEEESCVFTAKLTVNPEGKFTEITGYADELAKANMDESITPETADYHIELVVGQTIIINGKKLNGYDISGMDVVEIEDLDPGYAFKATKVGIANGNFHVGKEDLKSFYITVTEADKNDEIENATLTIK